MKVMEKKIKYLNYPDRCFFCSNTAWSNGLEEHHLWRGSQRQFSPSVFLCHRCHDRATFNKEFEIKLQKIYLYLYNANKLDEGLIGTYGTGIYNPKNLCKQKN